jgi:polyphosphate glucokinase
MTEMAKKAGKETRDAEAVKTAKKTKGAKAKKAAAPAEAAIKIVMSPGAGNILVIDIGGTNLKFRDSNHPDVVKIPSGPDMSAPRMVTEIKKATEGWGYTRVSMGYPGPVRNGRPLIEPHNLGPGWVGHDFEKSFGVPVRIVNDAAMQALGSYEGGRMLFLGLGTGLGSALIVEGVLEPMELAHLPYRKGKTYEDYVGLRGLERLGKSKWREHVFIVIEQLRNALDAEYVVLGGGNAKHLKTLPDGVRLGANTNAILGGFRLWDPKAR